MANTDGQIVLGLDISKTVKQINADIQKLQNQLKRVKATGTLDTSVTVKQINEQITALQSQLKTININAKIDTGNVNKTAQQTGQQIGTNIAQNVANGISQGVSKAKNAVNETAETINALKEKTQIDKIQLSIDNGEFDKKLSLLKASYNRLGLSSDEIKSKTNDVSNALEKLKNKNLDTLVQDEIDFTNALKKSQNEAAILKTKLDEIYNPKRQFKLTTDIQNWLTKNSRASSDAKRTITEYYQELSNGRVSVDRLEYIRQELQRIDAQQRGLGKLGKNLKDQFSEAAKGFTQWLSVSSAVMLLISKTKSAITEIKELDDVLTEISKTSNMTDKELKQLGMDAYDAASKYGRTASDYLTSVQEMARSGFYGEKGTNMAEASLLAQSAGDMEAELANNYVLATNAAYKFNGEAEKINASLDGQNSITNRNSVAMSDMAESMTIAGTVAAGYRVSIEDLSAMIGTMEAVTKSGGSEVGNAIKAILINLQNITSSKVVDTLDKANASMTEMVNGAEKLRNPINILRDLANTFNQLDEDDPLRAEILTNIGQKYHANKLGALLQNMDMYDKMLTDYAEGDGSALDEANKSATNLTGSINKLSNSWTEFVNGVVSSDELKTGVNLLNGLVKVFTSITSSGQDFRTTLLTIIGTIAQFKSKSGGLMRLIPIISNSPFLATVEFNSDVYDSCVCA